MINSILLQNFQSHKQTTLDFSKGVNLIHGKSDSGKSSIIRALNWVVNNRPGGDSIRSSWGGDTKVEVITKEDDLIQRVKTDKENYYTEGESLYKAMGQGVPKDTNHLLNISEINIQYQMDSPFLLSESAGEVARYFNKIVNLEKIDSTLRNVASMARDINDKIKFDENELEKEQNELSGYDWLDEAIEEFKQIEKVQAEEIKLRREYSTLSDLLSNVKNIKEQMTDIDFKTAETELKNIESLQAEESKLMDQISTLENILGKIIKLTEDIERSRKLIQSNEIELKKLMPDICPLCEQEIKK